MRNFLTILFITVFSISAYAHEPGYYDDMAQPFLKSFTVYPNPTQGDITITLETFGETETLQLKIYSLIGQEMHKEMLTPFSGSYTMELNLSKFPKGIYMVEISNGEKSKMKRISLI